MKRPPKPVWLRWILWNMAVLGGILLVGVVFIGLNCDLDCYDRGYKLGQGLGQLLIFGNLFAAIIYAIKTYK